MTDDLVRAIIELREMHADLQARVERMFRPGKVTDVDAAKGLYRQEIGTDAETGEPIKGPWVPVSQTAGGRKSHSMPSVGQGMMMISPDGDLSQAFGIPHHWSDSNPSPSQSGDEDVDTRGAAKDTMRGNLRRFEVGGASVEIVDGSVTIKAGGTTLKIGADGVEMSGGDVKILGGSITHDGHAIDKTHQHLGVRAGADLTGAPQ